MITRRGKERETKEGAESVSGEKESMFFVLDKSLPCFYFCKALYKICTIEWIHSFWIHPTSYALKVTLLHQDRSTTLPNSDPRNRSNSKG